MSRDGMREGKRQKRVVGDIVKIDLCDGFHTYARILNEAVIAFYDARVNKDLPLDRIMASPILFHIPVMDHAVKRGRWVVVGNAPLEDSLLNPPPRFIQDALRKDVFRIYESGRMRTATREECLALEREAVWDPTHVEDRLRDHFAGRKNLWVESLRMQD